jgi:hypothetical protein
MEESGQLHSPAALPTGKYTQYPLEGRLGGPHSQSGLWGEKKNLVPAGNRTPATQHLARRYTDSLHTHRHTDDNPETDSPYPWMLKTYKSRGGFFFSVTMRPDIHRVYEDINAKYRTSAGPEIRHDIS